MEHARHQNAEILLAHNGFQAELAHERHGRTALHRACKPGGFDVFQELLKKGATIDARDENDRLPIHYASNSGPVETVAALLAAEFSPNANDATGKTSLHMAAAGNDSNQDENDRRGSMLDRDSGWILFDQVDVNKEDAEGRTLIFEASENGHIHVVKALIHTVYAGKMT